MKTPEHTVQLPVIWDVIALPCAVSFIYALISAGGWDAVSAMYL